MGFFDFLAGLNREHIQSAIDEIKPELTIQEVQGKEAYRKLRPQERLFVHRYYKENVIQKSNRYNNMSDIDKASFEKQWDAFNVSQLISDGFKNPQANVPFLKAMDLVGKAVEGVAEKVEPEVPAGRTIPGVVLKDFPRQLGADFIRAYKPWNVLTFVAAAKVIKPAFKFGSKLISKTAKAVAPKTTKKIADVFTRQFTVGKGTPLAFQQAKKEAQLTTQAGLRRAEETAKVLTTRPFTNKPLSMKEQRIIGRIFRGEAETIRGLPKYQEYSFIAREARREMDKWSAELIKTGIPKKEAVEIIEENMGKYMARIYTKKMAQQKSPLAFFKDRALRFRLNGLKRRKDLSVQTMRELGQVKEPALPVATRVKEISETASNLRLFNTVANNPEWVADSNVTGEMVKMADSKLLGPLRNKFVVRNIADDINGILTTKFQVPTLYAKGISAWKFGKVVLNPATHSRNMMSNSMLLDLSGTNHLKQATLFPKAMSQYLKKGTIYQNALADGAIGGEFVGTEVSRLRTVYLGAKGSHWDKMMSTLKIPFRKAANVYQGEEQVAKLVKYMDVIEKGGSRKAAAEQAQKWLFNYQDIPKVIDFVKKSPFGAPFITFTYKAIPRVAEAITENPLRVYKYKAFFNAWNSAARKMRGLSPDEYAREQKALPPWLLKSIGGMPSTLLLPWNDKYGRSQWINLEYILPLGMAPEIAQKGVIQGGISNPVFNMLSELESNQDFAGKKIVPPAATKFEATKARLQYIYRQIAPSFAPGLWDTKTGEAIIKGGYSFEKVLGAVYKKPDLLERTRNLSTVLLDTLAGIKITPVDVEVSEYFNMKRKQELIRELRGEVMKLNHPAISEKTREREADRLFKRMQSVLEE